jgi:OOP family OmpA-OmpF porin
MRVHRLLALLLCIGAAPLAYSQMPKEDTVKGAKDHPLLSRFAGSRLVGYGVKEFEEVTLPAGKRIAGKDSKPVFDSKLDLEGKYTRIAYNFERERSSLEVMRNYQAALDKAGLKTVFSCAKEACGKEFGQYVWDRHFSDQFVKGAESTYMPFLYGRFDERYLLAKGTLADGSPVHVAVYVVAPVQDKNGGVYLEIVEGKPMEGGKVSANLDAGDMARGIAADGKVAVYGIYFDTGKAEVKPESKAALAEMAKLMQQDPKLKLYVVGHTDNQGVLAQNVDLSQRRAEAVVKVLTADYKIDARQLSAKGVASYAPVASNDADTGREKNRRVELVKQ